MMPITFNIAFHAGDVLRNLILLIACVVFPATVLALPIDSGSGGGNGASGGGGFSTGIKAVNNQIGFQTISTYVDYTETYVIKLDTETGTVPGRGYYYSSMSDILLGNDYFKVAYDQVTGLTNYVGAALSGGSYGSVVSTSTATITNLSFRYGKGFTGRNGFMLTPYVEVGTHDWERGVNYGESYTNNYVAYGLLNQYLISNRVVLSIDAMYGHTSQSAIVVTSGAGLTGFSGSLGDSNLLKVGVAVDYALSPQLHGNIGIDYTAFSYGLSAIYTGNLFEPDSATNYTTLRVGFAFGF